MNFSKALQSSLKTDKRTHTDPFLLHSRVCDLIGGDYGAKKAAEEFYRLDAEHEISKVLLSAAAPRRRPKKKHVYRLKPMPTPQDKAYVFYGADTGTLHLSGACAGLRNAPEIHRATYKKARRADARRVYPGVRGRLFRTFLRAHTPHVCRQCGDFRPILKKGFLW